MKLPKANFIHGLIWPQQPRRPAAPYFLAETCRRGPGVSTNLMLAGLERGGSSRHTDLADACRGVALVLNGICARANSPRFSFFSGAACGFHWSHPDTLNSCRRICGGRAPSKSNEGILKGRAGKGEV